MMIGDHLLPHRVQLIPSVESVDAYGNHTRVLGEPGDPVSAYVQPLDPSEDVDEGQYRESRYKVFIGTSIPELDAWSHILFEDRRYELVGDPKRHDTPAGSHHVTLTIRKVGA